MEEQNRKDRNDQSTTDSGTEQEKQNTQSPIPEEKDDKNTLNAGEDTAAKNDHKGAGGQQRSGGNPVINS